MYNWVQVYIHDPSKTGRNLEELLTAAGAKMLTRPPPSSSNNASAAVPQEALEAAPQSIVLIADPEDMPTFRPSNYSNGWLGVCVNKDWLIDSASNYCVQPLKNYSM